MISIRAFVKKSALLTALGYQIKTWTYHFWLKVFGRMPLDSEKILFYRSGGSYGDNPKAIAEYIHKNYPEKKLVWTYSNEVALTGLPKYYTPVKYESIAFFKELATAGAWVCSNILSNGTIKREGQTYIQTWHGDKFLKKIANDAATDIEEYKKRTTSRVIIENNICDYFVTGCDWFIPIAESALGYNGKFIKYGMPRNDCLFEINAEKCDEIKNSLGINQNTKILIYAPTFRDYEKDSGEIGSDIDLVTILERLETKYRQKWICLMRAHHGSGITINKQILQDERFIDVTRYPDMADLLMISDMLISDYSSCGADFAITGKMVLMYQDDLEQYTTKGRTLYFSREESPYFTAMDMNEAIGIIDRVTQEEIRKNSQDILKFYCSYETGCACKEVSKVIIDSLNQLKL